MYVCICNGVTDSQVRTAAASGCRNVAELTMRTGCGSNCGGCLEVAAQMLDEFHESASFSLPVLNLSNAA